MENGSKACYLLGPDLVQRLECRRAALAADQPAVGGTGLAPWDLLTEFQLQPEHADTSLEMPYRLEPIRPDRDASYTTHEMSSGALLWVHTQSRGGLWSPAGSSR
jgi:hypothetical protein